MRPLLDAGAVLAGRYRLGQPLVAGPDPWAWVAYDEVLARDVHVRALPARDGRAAAVLAATSAAGTVQHSSLTRVYDAATESRPDRPSVVHVVREWVDGRSLADLLADGPVEAARAVDLALQATEAVLALHDAGTWHGRLHPGNVLLDGSGRLSLTDAAVAAAAAGQEVPDPARDVHDLAAVLYALVTGRWPAAPDRPDGGLPLAPEGEQGVLSPRQVRAGVPRALDAVVVRALEPQQRPDLVPLRTAGDLRDALEQAADAVGREVSDVVPARPRRHSRLRRAVPYLIVLALLAVISVVSYSAGTSIGEVRADPEDTVSVDAPAATPGVPAPVRLDLSQAVVRDYDPYGRPASEDPGSVPNAYDGEASTAWTTEAYRTADLSGLKPGVGLLVDLGRPTALDSVIVNSSRPGAVLELRAGNALGGDETGLPVVATDTGSSGESTLRPAAGLQARYWLVWITRLPADGQTFRAGIDELVFLRR